MGQFGKQMEGMGHAQGSRYYPSQTLSLDELAHWIAFSRVQGIGPVRFRRLLDFFHNDVANAWKASEKTFIEVGFDQRTIHNFLNQRPLINPTQELERLHKMRIQVYTWRDESYPALLKRVENSPPVIYVCGNLTPDDGSYALSIVGTRKMTSYGKQVTEYLARELAEGKMTIVSGLALGVDTIAHSTALDANGRTLAVLPSGLDHIYPTSNLPLARRIVESGQGALVTAFPLGVKPDSRNFPARNYLVSGLSLGVIVTEAPRKSGALITAQAALEQGREVFAVPGSIFAQSCEGNLKLLQDGACLVTSAHEIMSNLNLFLVPHQPALLSIEPPKTTSEQVIFSLLSQEAQHIDELVHTSQMSTQEVISALTTLEMKGMVKGLGNMLYILAH